MVQSFARSLVERCGRGDHGGFVVQTEGLEHPPCEFLGIIYRKFCYGVECTHRARSEDAFHAVQPVYHIVPSADVFVTHFEEVLLRSVEGSDSRMLAENRRAESGLCIFHGSSHHVLVVRYDASDTYSAEVVSLGYRIHEYDILIEIRDIHGREVRLVRIGEFPVYFIGNEEKVVLACDLSDGQHVLL